MEREREREREEGERDVQIYINIVCAYVVMVVGKDDEIDEPSSNPA